MDKTESAEKDDKEDVEEKDVFEEGKLSEYLNLLILNYSGPDHFRTDPENREFIPYFEICSPPPEV